MARVCLSKMMKEVIGQKQPKTYLSALTKDFTSAPYGTGSRFTSYDSKASHVNGQGHPNSKKNFAAGGKKVKKGKTALKPRFLTKNQRLEVEDIFKLMSLPVERNLIEMRADMKRELLITRADMERELLTTRADMERELLLTRADLDKDTYQMSIGLYKLQKEGMFNKDTAKEEVKVYALQEKLSSLSLAFGVFIGMTGTVISLSNYLFK